MVSQCEYEYYIDYPKTINYLKTLHIFEFPINEDLISHEHYEYKFCQ